MQRQLYSFVFWSSSADYHFELNGALYIQTVQLQSTILIVEALAIDGAEVHVALSILSSITS
jgi:hypothetical protein